MPTNALNPSDYAISSTYGFLSPNPPPTSFKNPYYKPWDSILEDLPSLISSNTLNHAVDNLPILQPSKLTGTPEIQRAYVVLAFLVHALVWHRTIPNEKIPPQVAEPFLAVCRELEMKPVLSYAGLCTWNWRLRNPNDGGAFELENLDSVASFTGTRGEACFYLVPVLVEYEGGRLMHLLVNALVVAAVAGHEKARDVIVDALRETTVSVVRMGEQLVKLFATLDPQFFYHTHRPFMAGGMGMEEKGLPRGMVFERANGEEACGKFVGGSAVQSALFPFLDLALGVGHEDRVFADMRAYMPSTQRDFLERVSQMPSLREYAEEHQHDTELFRAYNDCLEQLRSWRGKHIAVVSKYIVQPAREAAKAAVVEKIEVEAPSETDKEWELQGTGGSALLPFLRQARDDTVGIVD